MRGVLVRPATSWMSVLGGWIATIGAMALVAPAVAAVLVGVNPSVGSNDIATAVPVVIGIFVSYLIGGPVAAPYVAREAGPVPGRTVGVGPVGSRSVKREAVIRRPPLVPGFGRKGGERVQEERVVEERRESDVDAT